MKITEITFLEESEGFVAYDVEYEEKKSYFRRVSKCDKFLLKKKGDGVADWAERANGKYTDALESSRIADLVKHHYGLYKNNNYPKNYKV